MHRPQRAPHSCHRVSRVVLLALAASVAAGCGAADPPDDPSSGPATWDDEAGDDEAGDDEAGDDAGGSDAGGVRAEHRPTVVVMQCPPGTVAVQAEPSKSPTVVVTEGGTITTPAGTQTVVTHAPLPASLAAECTPLRDKPAPVAQAPRVAAPAGVHPAVRAEVLDHYPKFRRCYEKGLARNPALAGKVVVRMKIDADGEVDEAYDWGSTLPDLKVVRCVVDEYEDMDFRTNVGKEVVYPLDFTPSVNG
jgi:hypothetical protein